VAQLSLAYRVCYPHRGVNLSIVEVVNSKPFGVLRPQLIRAALVLVDDYTTMPLDEHFYALTLRDFG